MLQIGYKLSSEEQRPSDLVRYAARAEDAGFTFALISDHFHPWIDKQGQSPFVWCVIGGIAEATEQLQLGTGVTCPTVRIHPAIIAHAAATAAAMMEGRFFLGVGTGENLNEHVVGQGWPETDVRQERLAEAIEIMQLLWKGGYQSHRGRHFTVENARLYTLPKTPPPIMVAVGGPKSAELAGRLGDGMVGTSPKKDTMKQLLRAIESARQDGLNVDVSGLDEFDIGDFSNELDDAQKHLEVPPLAAARDPKTLPDAPDGVGPREVIDGRQRPRPAV